MSTRIRLNKLISLVSARGGDVNLPVPTTPSSNLPVDPEGLAKIAATEGLCAFPVVHGAGPASIFTGGDIGLPFLNSHLDAFVFFNTSVLPKLVDSNYPTLEAVARSLRFTSLAPHADFASVPAMYLKQKGIAYPIVSTDFLTSYKSAREIIQNERVGQPPVVRAPPLHDLFSPREIGSIMWVNQMNANRMTVPGPSMDYITPGRRGGYGSAAQLDASIQDGLLAFVPVLALMMLMMIVMVAFERQRDDATRAGKSVSPSDTRRALKRIFSLGVDTDEGEEAERKALADRLEKEVNAQAHLVRREDLRFVPVPLEVHR